MQLVKLVSKTIQIVKYMVFKIASKLILCSLQIFNSVSDCRRTVCQPRIYFIPEDLMYPFSRIDKEQNDIYTLIPRRHKLRNSRSN